MDIPYSADIYLDLIRAVDRKAFAVHLDPVNMITNPLLYYDNANLIKECRQGYPADVGAFAVRGRIQKDCRSYTQALSK